MPPGKRLRVATFISRALKRYVDAHPDETLARDPGVFRSELSVKNTLPRSVPGPPGHDTIQELGDTSILIELPTDVPIDWGTSLGVGSDVESSNLIDYYRLDNLVHLLPTKCTPATRNMEDAYSHVPIEMDSSTSLSSHLPRLVCVDPKEVEFTPNPVLFWHLQTTENAFVYPEPVAGLFELPGEPFISLCSTGLAQKDIKSVAGLDLPTHLDARDLSTSSRTTSTHAIAVVRSASVPCTIKSSPDLAGAEDHQYHKRSMSTSLNRSQDGLNIGISDHITPALNGVSIYYSTKTQHIILDACGQDLLQLTNSQRIRRCSSFYIIQARPAHTSSVKRSLTTRNVRDIIKNIPFANLVRHESLEKSSLLQSIQVLQKTRSSIRKAAKARHRFRCGKIPSTSQGTLMRRAYPELKCDHCNRGFHGNDRRLRLARHRRKVHACATSSSTRNKQPKRSENSLRL
jgi:hypothetical protein